jgi:hypothetical protein
MVEVKYHHGHITDLMVHVVWPLINYYQLSNPNLIYFKTNLGA